MFFFLYYPSFPSFSIYAYLLYYNVARMYISCLHTYIAH